MRNERELRGRLHVSIIYCCKLTCITGSYCYFKENQFCILDQGHHGEFTTTYAIGAYHH